MMEFPPFGKDANGAAIRDISGIITRAQIEHLETIAGASMVEKLVQLLNERIPDRAYHVTQSFLRKPWNSYSYEFSLFSLEFCKNLSGDVQFPFNMARENFLSPILQSLFRPFSVPYIFRKAQHVSEKFTKSSLVFEVIQVTDSSAILQTRFTDHSYRQIVPYLLANAHTTCLVAKGFISAIPEKVYRLPPATVVDRACMAEGDEFCEYHITWQDQEPRRGFLPVVGKLARRVLSEELENRERLLEEQMQSLAARHEELGDAYAEQQVLLGGLEEKVRERTADLEEANEQLKELDRIKSEFFANISHEIRTPLTLILGSFRTLLKEQLSPNCQSVAQSGLHNAARLLGLINELLDLAKFDSGKMELRKHTVDLSAIIREISANYESDAKRTIHFCGGHQPILISLDQRQFKKVLDNLLSNAFKFNDSEQAMVSIRLNTYDGQVSLEVQDNGIGIPSDQIGRIFDRFTQVEESATRRYEGTGIGLALVKEIVERHNGTIAVESVLGKGSTFSILLPRGQDNVDNILDLESEEDLLLPVDLKRRLREVSSEPTLSSSLDGDRPLILVADDNGDMRQYLERILKPRYRIVLAKDGVEAFNQAQEITPDLILTDVMMPHMSGNELLRTVRDHEALRTVPVIFLTARAGVEAHIESLEAGADDYIAKPFNEEELLARIGNQLRLHAQERELEEVNARLNELNLRKSEFVSMVSHELRTPMTSISGLLDNMLEGLTGTITEKQGRYLDRVKFNIHRLTRMVNELLDLSRIEAGQIELVRKPVEIANVVESVVENLRTVAGEKGISIQIKRALSMPRIQGDADKLTQVVMNLIQNAIKFTPHGGQIKLDVIEREDGEVQVSVTDTGCGIPATDIEKVFEKFYRGQSVSKEARGAGLGLAIVKQIVELHGGRIWVESVLDEGSKFFFSLPIDGGES